MRDKLISLRKRLRAFYRKVEAKKKKKLYKTNRFKALSKTKFVFFSKTNSMRYLRQQGVIKITKAQNSQTRGTR